MAMLLHRWACVDMLAGPVERERDGEEKKDRKQRQKAEEGFLLFT